MASPPWSADECRMLVKYWGRWCNYHVAKRGKKLPDLLPGVAGGSGLAWLLAGLAPDVADKLPPLPHDKPRSRSHKVSNHVVLQRFMRHTLAIPLPDDCSAERLGDGDAVAVLALLWALALHFQFRALLPAPTSPRSHGGSDRQGAAVAAVRRALQDKLARFLARDETSAAREGGRTSVALSSVPVAAAAAAAISNFQQDFSDGALFSALIHRQCPEVLEVEGLDAKDKRGNLKRALRLLRRKWGVPKLVDVESLQLQAGVRSEEVEKCVMVYLALVFARFDDQPSPLLRRKSKGSFLFGSKSLPITATTATAATAATATSSFTPHPSTTSSSSTPSASTEHNPVVQTQSRSCSFPAVASVLPAAPRPPVSASSPSLLSGGTLDNLDDNDDGLSSGSSTSSNAPSPHQPRGDDVEDQLRQKQAAGYKGPRHSELFIDQATRLQLQATLDSFSRASQPPEHTTSTTTTSGSSSGSKGAEGGRRAGHSPHKKRAEPALQSRGSVIKSVHKKPEKESLQLLLECAMLGQDLDLSNQTFENFDSLIRFLAAKEAGGGDKPGNNNNSSSKSKSPSSRDGARPRAISDLDGEGSDVVSHTEVTDLSDLHSESDDDDVFDDDDLSELASLALDCAWDSPRYKKYLDPDFEPGDDTTDDGDLESTDTDFDATLTSLSEPSTPRSNYDKKDSGLMDLVADLRSLGLAAPPEVAAGDGAGVPATIVPSHQDLSALLLPRDVAQPGPRAPSPRDASVGPSPADAIAGPLAELHRQQQQQQRDVPLLHQSLPAPIATRPPPAPATSPEPVVGRLSQSQSLVGIGGGAIGQSPGGAPLFSDVRRLWQERATVTASSRKGRTWDNLQRAMEEEMIKKAKADGRRRQQLDTQPAPAATATAALQLASAAAQTSPKPADAAAAAGSSLHRPESAFATAALPPESAPASSDAMDTVRQELGRLEELMGAWERAKEAPYLHGVVLTTKSLVSRVKPLALAMGKQTGDEAALRSQELVGRMLELASLFRQNTTASDAVLQAKSREFVLAAAHLAHVVLPAATAPLVVGDDEHAVPAAAAKVPAPQRSTRAPDDTVPLGKTGKTEGRSPPIPSLRLAVLAPAAAAATAPPPQATQGESAHHPNVTAAAIGAVGAVHHQRDTPANGQQRRQANGGGDDDEDRFRAWRRDIGCCTFLDASSLRNFAELLRTVISHAQEVADRPEALQRRAQIVQDCQHLATAGAEWIRCGATCTSARTGGTSSSLQTPPKTPRTESRIKNRLLAAFDRLDKSVHATTSTSSGGSGPVTPTGRLSPTTRTAELSPRLAPRALSWSADELAGVSGGGEEVGLEEHVNLVVRGLSRAVGLCSDETGSDAPSGFHAADVRQLLRTITRALQVTAAKLPLEYRKAVLDAAEKYLQCAIPLVSAIEQCHAETEAAKRKELSQATHIARIRWMTAFRVLVTTLKDAVSAQQPSTG